MSLPEVIYNLVLLSLGAVLVEARGGAGEVGGGGFFGSPDDEEEKAEGFTGEEGSRRIFWDQFCDGQLCIRTGV